MVFTPASRNFGSAVGIDREKESAAQADGFFFVRSITLGASI
jgi:hypothetical protein